MLKRYEQFWKTTSIKNKIYYFSGVILLIILLFAVMDFWVIRFSMFDFHRIMEGNAISSNLAEALEEEREQFEIYMKDPDHDNLSELEASIDGTKKCIKALPYDYDKQSEETYRLTWNIINAYEVYVEHRDSIIRQGDAMQNYIAELYSIYDMQKYLQEYIRLLAKENLDAGNEAYFRKYPWLIRIPLIISVLILIAVGWMMRLSKMMNHIIAHPMEELAEASRKIAENEFAIEDIHTDNKDEVGELVQSFNIMKNAMQQYAQAVEENRIAREKIHEQELERVEMEHQLEAAKVKVLTSQMNPHFLFNTLNVIAGMANLENADITEKMTRSLSNLLRYTVHNDMAVVPLKKEIEVVEEYDYLQHMRFGARVRFKVVCRVDQDRYEIPPLTLQPLIENAVIHGISPKIEGGKILVKVFEKGEDLLITVADNGVGMSAERLNEVRNGISGEDQEHTGIAVRNISNRIKSAYPGGKMEIFSKENHGTVIRITVPKEEAACIGY